MVLCSSGAVRAKAHSLALAFLPSGRAPATMHRHIWEWGELGEGSNQLQAGPFWSPKERTLPYWPPPHGLHKPDPGYIC